MSLQEFYWLFDSKLPPEAGSSLTDNDVRELIELHERATGAPWSSAG